MGRAPCCDKASVKRGPWSPEEDARLKAYIEANGTGGNWIALPQKIGLKRCGKSCRLRWLNYLRPNIKHGGFSEEEDNIICSLYISIGSRWSIIAAQLPGRTDNDIKNYWNTRLKKKLLGKQRKEQQARRAAAAAAAATCLAFKQGMKTENDYIPENYMVSGMVSQAPYWQQFPATAYMPSPMNLRYPLDVSLAHQDHQQLYHQNSMNMISSSFSNISNNFNVSNAGAVVSATPNTNMFQGLEGLSSELSELIYSLDAGVYETGTDSIVDGSSTGTSSVESSSWEDMNSLGYTQILSGFEACHQNMPQVSTLDESNYLGPQ